MSSVPVLSRTARVIVLIVAFTGLLFDGVELGRMPICTWSLTKDLLGDGFTKELFGSWFAWLTASLMLGAAVGGVSLGALGDRIGRTRALGVSILFYSIFAGLGAFVTSMEQMLVLRFLVGLGVGGVWPNGVALVSECWPNVSRPLVAGIMGAGINVGVVVFSQVAKFWHITPDSWRWVFSLSAVPVVLGIFTLVGVPESPRWLASRQTAATAGKKRATPLKELFQPPLLRITLVGMMLGSVPLVGAWAGAKWFLPWADAVGGVEHPGYKALTQQWWGIGAVLGSFFGAQLASLIGRRLSYFLISLGSTILTSGVFIFTAPLRPEFLPLVFFQGFVATLFFGWLPLFLPEMFPTRVRATGSGIAFNVGRFATAVGVFITGWLVGVFGGDISKVGATAGLIYALGMVAIWLTPDTKQTLED